MSTYNAEDTIARALNSLICQSVCANEIIVVDDNSSDRTRQILYEISKSNPKINLVFLQKNLGQSHARNLAGELAKSDILMFFDDDDYSKPLRAEEHLKMHLDSEISYVSSTKLYSNNYEVKCTNRDTRITLDPGKSVRKLILGKDSDEMASLWIPASTSSFSRNFFRNIGGYDTSLRRLEDVDIFLRAAVERGTVRWTSKNLVDRYATFSNIKGGRIETKYEEIILNKYGTLLTVKESRDALSLIHIRRAYFTKNLFSFCYYAIRNPSIFFLTPERLIRFFKRLIHDIRKS